MNRRVVVTLIVLGLLSLVPFTMALAALWGHINQRPNAPAASGSPGRAAPQMAVAVNTEGLLTPLSNGQVIPVGAGLEAVVHFSPYPPTRQTDLDLALREEGSGTPVHDAQVLIRAEMPFMGHGVPPQMAGIQGAGRYRIPLRLTMAGEWEVSVEIMHGDRTGRLVFSLGR